MHRQTGIVLGRQVVSLDNLTKKNYHLSDTDTPSPEILTPKGLPSSPPLHTPLLKKRKLQIQHERPMRVASTKSQDLPQLPTTLPAIILQDTVKTNIKPPRNSLSLREGKKTKQLFPVCQMIIYTGQKHDGNHEPGCSHMFTRYFEIERS